jgi:hypothetical protein
MNAAERKEFQHTIRGYLQNGRLTDDQLFDMALLYASLGDSSLDGKSFKRLKKYEEVGKGWAEINAVLA